MQIRPYLTFKGECQEAIDLYSRAFNTKVSQVMRFSDIPLNPNNPMTIAEHQKNWVVQATLPFGDNFMRLSDCTVELNDAPSERISIAVECSVDEVKLAFAVLSEEGEVGIPLQKHFSAPVTVLFLISLMSCGILWRRQIINRILHKTTGWRSPSGFIFSGLLNHVSIW